ncbi:hypothetical protein [Actinoplanes derwentensis]|uniref:Head-to-tail stopper n=1 Tax=Actinoplanes derwentensis TaxID=113562 RepID=A0A1H2CWG4_9ACTN|nr:hypothetical protein [Actinoplanes derwentensis]GID82014.1 hypothetical protein Ade03nite_09380 [Actinoplanes derwentensis]SDT74366.1 hypothetical protein SAMN04489716_6960 [Actinoplanes derwentensis]
MAGTETVTVIRPPGKDPFGDPLPDGEQRFDVPGCRFAPGPSRETGNSSGAVQSDGTVYARRGTAQIPNGIAATDLVQVRGIVYTVVGHPQDWGRAGTVIVLRRYTG